jgi:hypothetical protein
MDLRIILMVLLLSACTARETETPSESSDEPGEELAENRREGDSIVTEQDTIMESGPARTYGAYLRCNRVIDNADTSYIVYVIAKDIRTTLDTVAYCNPINRSSYDQFDIPQNAIDACGGWHEEAGEYFYLMEEGLDLVVYHAWLKEEQTTNAYPYKEVHRLKLPEIEL